MAGVGSGSPITPLRLGCALVGLFGVWILVGDSIMLLEREKPQLGCPSGECIGQHLYEVEDMSMDPARTVDALPAVSREEALEAESLHWSSRCPHWYFRGTDRLWRAWPEEWEGEAGNGWGLQSRKRARIRAAIVFLARHKNVADLLLSLARLSKYYLDLHFGVRVLVFHDDLQLEDIKLAREAVGRAHAGHLEFHEVRFCVPNFLKHDPPPTVGQSPINYRHMMRFFARALVAHPAMIRFTHYARMDADSLLVAPVEDDFFKQLRRSGALYGYAMLWKDGPQFLAGMADVARQWLEEEGQEGKGAEYWDAMGVGRGGEVSGVQFWNNFEVVDMRLLRSTAYQNLAKRMDESELMYTERIGDAVIRSVAVAAMLRPDQILEFHDLAYQHQSQFRCPLDEAEGGSGKRVDGFTKYSTGEPDAEGPVIPFSARDSACDLYDGLDLIRDRCNSKKTSQYNLEYCSLTRRAPCPIEKGQSAGHWAFNDVPHDLCDFVVSQRRG